MHLQNSLVSQCTELTCKPVCIEFNSCSWQAGGGGSHSEPVSAAGLSDLLPFPLGTVHCGGLSREEQRHLTSQRPWALHQQCHPLAECAVHRQVSLLWQDIPRESRPTLARVKCGDEAGCILFQRISRCSDVFQQIT